jgi:hypothetical protein
MMLISGLDRWDRQPLLTSERMSYSENWGRDWQRVEVPGGDIASCPGTGARTCGDFVRTLWFVYCDRFPSRRTGGWAVCSHSTRGTTPPTRWQYGKILILDWGLCIRNI